jgi:hypothetical protein
MTTEDEAIDDMLKDLPPRVRFFVESLIEATKALALLYAATPDAAAEESLKAYIDRIRPDIVDALGASTATKLLEIFSKVVLSEKRRLESVGISRA